MAAGVAEGKGPVAEEEGEGKGGSEEESAESAAVEGFSQKLRRMSDLLLD